MERRYSFPIGKLMGVVREALKWADGKLVKEVTETEVRSDEIQWTPSNPATLGTSQSVLIRGVASFQGPRLEGVHLVALCGM